MCNTEVFLIVIFIYTLAYNCIFFLLLIRTPKGIILHPCFYDLPSPRSLRSFISTIRRLNSGIKIWHNFFYMGAFFQLNFMCRFWEYQKFFFQFPGNPILKFMFNFWNCVGGAHMRECLILKITQCIYLIDLGHKFARGCPPTQTPTQKLKSRFLKFSSQEIGSSLISLQMIFWALPSELFRFKFHSLGSKIQKFPDFNLTIYFVSCIGWVPWILKFWYWSSNKLFLFQKS